MTSPEWQRLEALYAEGLQLDPSERAAWLDRTCGDDPALRTELESLFAAREHDPGFMSGLREKLVGGGARDLLDDDGESAAPTEPPLMHRVLGGHEAEREMAERLTAALADTYKVKHQIGVGGMATVFLAEDLKHRREVAIKVLQPELAAVVGTERFLREIELTAGLQHPNILPLFDSGIADGIPYYVMPFIQGESLDQRLRREKQLSIDDAIAIGTAVGDALHYAHQNNIVHRDIKPANILLHRGQPVVADFGIALAVSRAGDRRLTETGLSIGTPEYMSPEQAAGTDSVDARTDQYALACVMYEMLVGEPPHSGPTVPAIIAKVMTEAPRRIRAGRETVPPHVEMAIHRGLNKLPADRYPSVGQFVEALINPAASGGWRGLVQLRGFPWRLWATRAALVVLAATTVWGLATRGTRTAPNTVRFQIPFPASENFGAVRHALAISNDGQTIAYAGFADREEQLHVRPLDQLQSRVLPGTEGAMDPFFSPDGATLGYATVVGLRQVPVTGGTPVDIVQFPEPRGPSWTEDGIILFGSTRGLFRVAPSGGAPEQLTTVDAGLGELMHSRPQELPGTDAILFTITRSSIEDTEVAVLNPTSGEITRLFRGVSPRYSETGHILYGRPDGMLMAVAFDPRRLEVTAAADTVLSGITVKQTGSMDFSVSASGSMVYLAGAEANSRLALVDRTGTQTMLATPGWYVSPQFSPDGRRILVGRGLPPTRQIWTLELADETLSPSTFEGHNYYPVWNPDATRFVFTTETNEGGDLRWKAADGTGAEELLLKADPGEFFYPEDWSPDGRYLVLRRQDAATNRDLWIMDVPSGEARPLFDLPSSLEDAARISPDGNWIAFSSDLNGRYEVYVTTFPDPGRRIPVSLGGGTEPAWEPDSRGLFYWNENDFMTARFDPAPDPRVSEREVLLTGRYVRWLYHTNYDVHPDGQQFVMLSRVGAGASQNIIVATNWFEEFQRILDSN